MEHIWSPWRYRYVAGVDSKPGCVLCRIRDGEMDRENLVLIRASLNFIVLNLYPYTSGHLMIVPFEHKGSLAAIAEPAAAEMMTLARRAQLAIEAEYNPDGFNIGMNLGGSAGAGIADHLHLHVVPRWAGDANFVSVIGETRVLPEDLSVTYEKLKRHFQG